MYPPKPLQKSTLRCRRKHLHDAVHTSLCSYTVELCTPHRAPWAQWTSYNGSRVFRLTPSGPVGPGASHVSDSRVSDIVIYIYIYICIYYTPFAKCLVANSWGLRVAQLQRAPIGVEVDFLLCMRPRHFFHTVHDRPYS